MCSIIMEYADGGDILSKIKENKDANTNMSEDQVWSYALQMLMGLKALHDRKVLHRDLKSANGFLCLDGTLKLGDMNVSKIMRAALTYT